MLGPILVPGKTVQMPSSSSPNTLSQQLLEAVNQAVPALRSLDEARSALRSRADRWAAREELGHLIDSALNNHRRVVVGRASGTLNFDGYDQDAWVDAHGYAEMPWLEIVELWTRLNHHLARVVSRVPADVLDRQHADHCMDRIGFRTYQPGASASLADLVEDYIEHLEHHLHSIETTVASLSPNSA
jgi:hypothetical protein